MRNPLSDRLRELWGRTRSWFRDRGSDRDFEDELSAHVDLAVAEEIARGKNPAEARRSALLRLGGLDQAKELHRQSRGLPWLEALGRDIRDAARLLRRSPAFTAVAILSLALGIGANTAMFSIFNSLVLRDLPVRAPSELVQLVPGPESTAWTNPLWEEIRSRPSLFAGTLAWGSVSQTNVSLIERGELAPLDQYWVSGSFFDVLGIRPARGRLLTNADDVRGGPVSGAVAVISDGFWRRRFGGSEDAVGSVLTLNHFSATIVGVTPANFLGPEVGNSFDLILPLGQLPRQLLDARGFSWVSVMARLKPGQTADDVSRALRAMQPAMRDATLPAGLRPQDRDAWLSAPFSAVPAATGTSSLRVRYQQPLVVIMAAVGLVLLIACANIANLLLARADARRHEFSVRLALGASRGQLVRQLLIESLMLSALGGFAGLAVAVGGGRLLVHELSTSLPLPLDWRVLNFMAAVATLTALLFGVGPAIRATRVAPRAALAEKGRTIVGTGRWRVGHALVIAQVALSLVLAVGAGLLVKTFASLAYADLGFDPYPVLAVNLWPRPGVTLGTVSAVAPRLEAVLSAVRAVPGVASAAFAGGTTPMDGFQWDNFLENPEGLSLPESERETYFRDAGLGWFATLGMRIVKGRDFGAEDIPNYQSVAVVSETLARRFFPGRDPIGQVLREVPPPTGPTPAVTIVGVVADSVYNSARQGFRPTLYHLVPSMQALIVRAQHGNPLAIARPVTEAIRRTDADWLTTSRPLATQVRATVARERLVAMLSGFFGALALLLAGVGVYGVMAYAVGQRRTEIAVRRALGATGAGIARLVIGRSLTLVASGVAIGTIASLCVMGLLQPLLYRLGPRDPATIGAAALLLALVGLLAAWAPARRAVKASPAAVSGKVRHA